MRENRTYGSEGGEANAFPTPIGIIANLLRKVLSSPLRRLDLLRVHRTAFADVVRRVENHLVAVLDLGADLKCGAMVAHHSEFAQVDDAIFNDGDAEAVAIEDDGFGRNDQGIVLRGICSSTSQ